MLFIVYYLHSMCGLTLFNPEPVSAFSLNYWVHFNLENVLFQSHIVDLLYCQYAVEI